MICTGERGVTVGACRFHQKYETSVLLTLKKAIPVDGTMIATASTLGIFGRCRWFLMEVGEAYVIVSVSPVQQGCTYSAVAHCQLSAIMDDEKQDLRDNFEQRIAILNGGPLAEPASFYPGRGH